MHRPPAHASEIQSPAAATPAASAATAHGGDDSIAARVAQFARHAPASLAIVDRGVELDYAQLDRDATSIAQVIDAVSGRRIGRVGLLFDDKVAAVRAIVGSARSGHAYVTLDAGDPEERLRFILGDSAPAIVLTEPAHVERARRLAPAGCAVIELAQALEGDAARELPSVDGETTAYLYYTSGSTGRPKGVRQSHANLRFFVDSYARAVGIGAGDRISMMYAVSFAAGIGGIYRALALGGTLCAFDLKREGLPRLADWLDRERISVLHTFPLVFREMAKRLGPERVLPHLKVVHLGGESVFGSDVEQFRRHTLPHCRLVHQLSATEIGIIAQKVLRHDAVLPAGSVLPVGKPVPGVRVEVVRDDGTPAAIGESGAIFACSRHLSPGYWQRPDLDAAAFFDDPAEPGGRRYRTGDFGRIDVSGDLHFLGRAGNRVKIRGHTVDVAEVDAALAACPDIAEGAVIAEQPAAPGADARLVAFVVAREGARRDVARIRRDLVRLVPLHMVPAEIRFVEALPRTAGGKLDRNRLPDVATLAGEDAAGVAPRDAIEAAVAHVFEQLLDTRGVFAGDDFFLLGGDSLLAADLQSRLRDAFGVQVGNFHLDATVSGIATAIRGEQKRSGQRMRAMPLLVPLWPNGRETPLFIVHGRQGQAYISPQFMQLLGDEQPVWAFQARGLDGISEPHPSVEAMTVDYVAALRDVRPHGPYFLGGLCIGGFVAAAMARMLADAGEEVLPLLLLDPPNRVRVPEPANSDPAFVAGKIKARHAAGRILGPMDDPQHLEASVRTAIAFNAAALRYQPEPYAGAVYVLSSRNRMHDADPFDLRTIFRGRFKRYEVGQSHKNALDPRNPVFASTLTRCVELIRASARGA